MLASNLSLKNENQLLQNQVDNLKQNFRLELREKDLELRKLEDDFHWRRSNEMKNSENLIKGVDLLQLENMELKRDIDSLRALVEEKEERTRSLLLEQRQQRRVMDDLNAGAKETRANPRNGNEEGQEHERENRRSLQKRVCTESSAITCKKERFGNNQEILPDLDGQVHRQLRTTKKANRRNAESNGHGRKINAEEFGQLQKAN